MAGPEESSEKPLLLKDVLRQGQEGQKPKPGDTVQVHYVCYAAASEAILDSTRARSDPFTFTLGQDEVVPGLEQAVAGMELGEQASLRIHPSLTHAAASWAGYEASGDVDVWLRYDVELLKIGAPESAKSAEQRMMAAYRAKDAGNASFKGGDLQAAVESYHEALEQLSWTPSTASSSSSEGAQKADTWVTRSVEDERKKLAITCCLNLSQCGLKLENFSEAVQCAEHVLEHEPSNPKALYRAGQANMQLGNLDKAHAQLRKAATVDPTNKEVRAQLEICSARCGTTGQKDKAIYGGMFKKVSLYSEKAVDSAQSAKAEQE